MIPRVSNDDDRGEMLARAISSVKASVWLCWRAGYPCWWNSGNDHVRRRNNNRGVSQCSVLLTLSIKHLLITEDKPFFPFFFLFSFLFSFLSLTLSSTSHGDAFLHGPEICSIRSCFSGTCWGGAFRLTPSVSIIRRLTAGHGKTIILLHATKIPRLGQFLAVCNSSPFYKHHDIASSCL
ncbi:hypothetical protein B9Z19DRAFT_410690 [Tuber borchii]|uniref:Uncharacterized protein n=1 Tax=Tuber borchii TaxID=42251 RepID=A0A2T6ZGR8_TUBBO|nr:hypothetical protein B9Z19DRAFT_410690 [Tuber borchii]